MFACKSGRTSSGHRQIVAIRVKFDERHDYRVLGEFCWEYHVPPVFKMIFFASERYL